MTESSSLSLGFGFSFGDLYDSERLAALDAVFLDYLTGRDAALAERLKAARHAVAAGMDDTDESALLLALAEPLEDFLAELFGIGQDLEALIAAHKALEPLQRCRRLFVQRRALKTYRTLADLADYDGGQGRSKLEAFFGEPFSEKTYAQHVLAWMEDEAKQNKALEEALRYAAWACLAEEGRHWHRSGSLFTYPRRLDMNALVHLVDSSLAGVRTQSAAASQQRLRDGFELTDTGMNLDQALGQAHYCIYCHHQGKDSCSKGFVDKSGDTIFTKNAFGEALTGCPLGEKISEMNWLKGQGFPLSSLAIAVVDNPMLAGTGHRICNDCMKSCIYQKQEPVDIPQIETRVLKDVLALPWGFEIYSLLTRWNPLHLSRPYPRAYSGYKVLVVGLGPAGYTLAHHLLNDGHAVVAIDGLKLEPLPSSLSGVDLEGERHPFEPIHDIESLYEPLQNRVSWGFGGVAEYGITVRWNKNFLKILRLLLERRANLSLFGGIRLGGNLSLEDAWQLGFDHIALCMGAGKPTVIAMKNGLAAGVRQASDFLMGLQLTGASKDDSVSNLQLRLPVVVIGGRTDGN